MSLVPPIVLHTDSGDASKHDHAGEAREDKGEEIRVGAVIEEEGEVDTIDGENKTSDQAEWSDDAGEVGGSLVPLRLESVLLGNIDRTEGDVRDYPCCACGPLRG